MEAVKDATKQNDIIFLYLYLALCILLKKCERFLYGFNISYGLRLVSISLFIYFLQIYLNVCKNILSLQKKHLIVRLCLTIKCFFYFYMQLFTFRFHYRNHNNILFNCFFLILYFTNVST